MSRKSELEEVYNKLEEVVDLLLVYADKGLADSADYILWEVGNLIDELDEGLVE